MLFLLIIKPEAWSGLIGNLYSSFSLTNLIYVSNRSSSCFSLSARDRLGLLSPKPIQARSRIELIFLPLGFMFDSTSSLPNLDQVSNRVHVSFSQLRDRLNLLSSLGQVSNPIHISLFWLRDQLGFFSPRPRLVSGIESHFSFQVKGSTQPPLFQTQSTLRSSSYFLLSINGLTQFSLSPRPRTGLVRVHISPSQLRD